MENGWWASTRREDDANLHVELLRSRNERYTPRVVGLSSIWAVVTLALIALPIPGIVALGGSAGAAVALPLLARSDGTTQSSREVDGPSRPREVHVVTPGAEDGRNQQRDHG